MVFKMAGGTSLSRLYIIVISPPKLLAFIALLLSEMGQFEGRT